MPFCYEEAQLLSFLCHDKTNKMTTDAAKTQIKLEITWHFVGFVMKDSNNTFLESSQKQQNDMHQAKD